ncbi:MAG TPA: hypothetical protein VKI17_04035 [Gemmataceae bacterium]|nr:hypothetical protein [Gemmataceae bacterium]
MIRMQCPKCEKKLGVSDSLAGGVGTCPECGQKFRIPGKPVAEASAGAAPARKQTVPAKQGSKLPAQPSRPKEAWEEEDSSPYKVHDTLEHGEDAKKLEYGVDKEYVKKLERKRVDDAKKEFRTFIGLIALLLFIGAAVNCLQLIMEDLVYVPVGLGLAIFLVGTGMLASLGFHKDFLQALLVILPGYDIFYTVTHFQDARNALVIKYIGALICGAGLYFGGLEKVKGLIDKARESSSSRPAPVLVVMSGRNGERAGVNYWPLIIGHWSFANDQ